MKNTPLRRIAAMALLCLSTAGSAEPLPPALKGSWRITQVLPTTNDGCWKRERALPLVGTLLTYRPGAMIWRGGVVRVQEVTLRNLTNAEFRKENPGAAGPADFAQLGITAAQVQEVDLQHEDADITGVSTEVPGDSILLVSPARIIVSACGVYMEARRVPTK
jgi:hypothetical protein